MDTKKQEWQTGKPPNETPVEVEYEGKIIVVKAFYGRDGTKPHWRNELGTCWEVGTFQRWKHIKNIFSNLKDTVSVETLSNGLAFHWTRHEIGFGTLTLKANPDGYLIVDDQCMSDEFDLEIIKQAFKEKKLN